MGIGEQAARQVEAVITYIVVIPCGLFWLELFGAGWKKSILAWLWAEAVFAPLAIAAGVIGGYSRVAGMANSILVLAGTVLVMAEVWLRRRSDRETAVIKYSLTVFAIFVVATNLGVRRASGSIEGVSFLVLLCGLAYTAAARTIAREQKLIAVEQELETARRIQISILPAHPPQMEGLRIAARYQPMNEVAGDFYDFIRLDGRRVTILVADVSGHGVPAALIASMLKVGFAAQSHNASNPAAILAGLNLTLGGLLAGQFVTAACVFVDLDSRMVTYSGAGHPPSLLFRQPNREVVELSENGLFLGPFRHARYANATASFQPGDRLLLYTDGIVEATFKDHEPFGGERLKDFTRKVDAAEPALFVEQLFQAVSGPVQEDDLTVVVAQSS